MFHMIQELDSFCVLVRSVDPSFYPLQFSRRTPFNVVCLVLIVLGAVAASDLCASELDGLVMMRQSVKEQNRGISAQSYSGF